LIPKPFSYQIDQNEIPTINIFNDYKLAGEIGIRRGVSHLPVVSVAHFACHGQHNAQDPLESALLFQDGPLKVSEIMGKSMPHASLAFLSACEPEMGDQNFPDEVIHLEATLLFAGFRGVVATMW
jgi:CHAT domain-containing protein